MAVIAEDININCPSCKAERKENIGEVWYENETISRRYCSKCGAWFFLSVKLVVKSTAYKIEEETTHAE